MWVDPKEELLPPTTLWSTLLKQSVFLKQERRGHGKTGGFFGRVVSRVCRKRAKEGETPKQRGKRGRGRECVQGNNNRETGEQRKEMD